MNKKILKDLSFDALYFNTLLRIFQQLISALVIYILVRKISPSGFGIVNSANIFVYFLCAFFEIKLFASIIQKKDQPSNELLSTLFYLHFFISFFITAICWTSSLHVADYFNDIDVAKAIELGSLNFIIMSFCFIQKNMLIRNLEYKKIAFVEAVSVILSGIIAVFTALNGHGFLSLIYKGLSQSIIMTVLYNIVMPWIPKMYCKINEVLSMIRFGFDVLLIEIFAYINNKIPETFIAKFLSMDSAGLFSMASRLSSVSNRKMKDIISNIIFSAFSKIQEDKYLVSQAFFKALKVCAVLNIPFLIVFSFISHDIVMIVYGPQWLSAVFPMQLLCFYWMIVTFFIISDSVFLAAGKAYIKAFIEGISTFILLIMLVFSVKYGITAVALAMLLVSLITFIINFHYVNKLLKCNFYEYLIQLKDINYFIILFSFSAIVIHYVLLAVKNSFIHVILYLFFIFSIYCMLIFKLHIDGVDDIKKYLHEKFFKRIDKMNKFYMYSVLILSVSILVLCSFFYKYCKEFKENTQIFKLRQSQLYNENSKTLRSGAFFKDIADQIKYSIISLSKDAAFGFRDEGVKLNPYGVVFGGSNVFGRGIIAKKRFSELAEAELALDIVNAGIEYYSIKDWEADGINKLLSMMYPINTYILTVSMDTDILLYNNEDLNLKKENPISYYFKNKKKKLKIVKELYGKNITFNPYYAMRSQPSNPSAEFQTAQEELLRSVLNIKSQIVSKGHRFIVILLPSIEQVYSKEFSEINPYKERTDVERSWIYLKNALSRNNVDCIDMLDLFRQDRKEKRLFQKNSRDISEYAHKLCATTLVFYLKANKL